MTASTHGQDCPCTRCTGFQPGHELSVRHGAYGTLVLAPRADEIAAGLRELVPAYSPIDEPAVRTLALVLARIERATAALDQVDDRTDGGGELRAYVGDGAVPFGRLRDDLRGWINTARRLFNDLGLTPTSRAKLRLDVALGESAAQRALDEHVARTYGDGGVERGVGVIGRGSPCEAWLSRTATGRLPGVYLAGPERRRDGAWPVLIGSGRAPEFSGGGAW